MPPAQSLRVLVPALLCGIGTRADAQVLLFEGPEASAGEGGGARTVLRIDDAYVVFFHDGDRIAYRRSADGAAFSAPETAVATDASHGFAVARSGSTVGVVWANLDGARSRINYTEAPAHLPLIFGQAVPVDSATEARGVAPSLAFTPSGVPFIAAGGSGVPFTDFGDWPSAVPAGWTERQIDDFRPCWWCSDWRPPAGGAGADRPRLRVASGPADC